ncbi:MAG: hypothetical protein B6U94_00670 [Thermofilum sp. ex4484_79]|nr:MAG: hypothetical protein B6U94_00670 [Thermofilum sp. ex4484_79]
MAKIEVSLTKSYFRKYPFLPDAIRYISELGLTLEDLSYDTLGKEVISRAKEIINAVINSSPMPYPHEDPDIEVLSYLVTLIVLKIIDDRQLIEKFATTFSKRCREYMETEQKDFLLYLATVFKWKISLGSENIYILYFVDYLENIPEFKGSWKLVNRKLSQGWIELDRIELIRLIESGLKKYFSKQISDISVSEFQLPDPVYALVEEISRLWSTKLAEYDGIRAKYLKKDEKFYPPCISSLIESLKQGKNLTHSARFALASFLLNIGMNVDEVIEVFKFSPDFREDLARYQIEHIAGLRGSKTKYVTYKCDNMRSLGLCYWDCKGITHPLQYYYKAVRGKMPHVEKRV